MDASLFFLNRDARILDRIREGDEGALVSLYESSRKPVYAFVTRNRGSLDDAEDLVQEALIVLWERVRAGRFVYAARLDTFIYATVRNMWYRRLSRIRRETPTDFDLDFDLGTEQSVLEDMIENEESQLVRRAMDTLGDPCKTLLLLYYWEERSMEEIARTMGFANAETAKSTKYRCKKALKRLLIGSM